MSIAKQQASANLNFDWGESGVFDDARLYLDEQGQGRLVESIILNKGERDGSCGVQDWRYRLMVK